MANAEHIEPLARHDLLAHHDPKWGDLERLLNEGLMFDTVIDEIDGRRIRAGDKWMIDFASCNYLGFDLDPEERLTALLGAQDTLVLPTITHIHMSVLPVLTAGGYILLDRQSHKTIYDAC